MPTSSFTRIQVCQHQLALLTFNYDVIQNLKHLARLFKQPLVLGGLLVTLRLGRKGAGLSLAKVVPVAPAEADRVGALANIQLFF